MFLQEYAYLLLIIKKLAALFKHKNIKFFFILFWFFKKINFFYEKKIFYCIIFFNVLIAILFLF